MKNHFYKVVLLFIVLLSSSCNKWLELEPQDGITRQEFWKTKEDVQAAAIGIYGSLLNEPLVYNLFTWGELRADMISATLNTTTDESNIMTANILSSNSLTSWRALYQTINYCNTLIEFAPQVLKTDPTFKQADLDAYLAEAYAIRGLMYFYLLRTFRDVPLKLSATSSDATLELLPKSSETQVYNQIIKDLDFAALHAKTTYQNQDMDKGRVTKYTVYAIQADAYLWMNDYEKCVAACDKIIGSNRFGLIPTFSQSSWFNTLFYNGNSNESIFEFQFDSQKLNPFHSMFVQSNRRFLASSVVMDEVYTVNSTDETKYDYRGNRAALRASDGMIWKFSGAQSGSDDIDPRPAADSYAHWIVYRYADILLLKAEALAWLNRGQEAIGLVNVIRERGKALESSARNPDVTSAIDVSEYVLEERARELAFEGKRWFDVLRNAKRNNYENLNLLLQMVIKNAPPQSQQIIVNKFKDPNSHYLPINDYELTTDKNLVQNPFYQK